MACLISNLSNYIIEFMRSIIPFVNLDFKIVDSKKKHSYCIFLSSCCNQKSNSISNKFPSCIFMCSCEAFSNYDRIVFVRGKVILYEEMLSGRMENAE